MRRSWLPGSAAIALVVMIVAPGALHLQLRSEQQLSPAYAQGIARVPGGWIVSGTNLLARVDESLRVTAGVGPAIPPAWAAKGYDHIGDIDVVGGYIYAPFEQHPFSIGRQATARYDVRTLGFVDAVELAQHENSFVTVDPRTMIAYSMDHFGGKALLRYDVRKHWKRLRPLAMSRRVNRVQGADVARGAVWLSTDDDHRGVYRVDLRTGAVDDLGSAGHAGGEGEGIDATPVGSASLHVMTVDPKIVPVWVGNFAVVGRAGSTLTSGATSSKTDSSWPPVLVAAVAAFALACVIVGVVVYRRARAAARDSGPSS